MGTVDDNPGAPRITISAVTDLGYALAHCRIPVVHQITVENPGPARHGAVLDVEIVDATGPHGEPHQLHLDLAENQPTVLRDVNLTLDPASMLAVDEQRPGTIRATLRDNTGAELATAAVDVTILAANQWKANPPQLGLEMLAAYVQPNATAVTALLTDVSDRLKAATGNSAIDGYQSEDPARVDAIAKAVFEAMQARDIRYAEPPASWGDDGQKVRTPAEVLDGRLGTCLDTTLVMAAVLEQAGINSTIWVVTGHAFLGYWRADAGLPTISTTDAIDVVNQVDLGVIGLVETTMIPQPQATFAEATRAPKTRLAGDLSNIIGVTDIRQARRAKIFPLPSRVVDGHGNVVVTHYQPGVGPTIAPYVGTPKHPAAVDTVPARVSQWKNALLDLSLRNRLINYTDRAGYRLEVPGPALARFEDSVNAGAHIRLLASDAVPSIDAARGIRYGRDLPEPEREVLLADKHSAYIDITDAAYTAKLRYLANKARTILEETGSNNLYLAFGMLNWRFGGKELRSPLVLVPVALSTANRGSSYLLTIDEAGASTPNYCLVEKLRTSFGLELPELANPAEDASGIDLAGTFDAVRRAIAAGGLPARVEETVHLSILQFAKFPLWKDLDDSWAELAKNSLVQHLVDTPLDAYTDPVDAPARVDLDDLGAALPVPADSSQLHAVADAAAGRTFVLEGPPGTGKSQTITNLLAHAMASGLRVLFVAEKRAALDVVKKRLREIGLGELSLDLHDKSARPAAVRAQIKAALELRVSTDADLLTTSTQTAESARRSLARYAERLHQANAAGQSLYTARSSELAADQDVAPLTVPRSLVAAADADTFGVLRAVLRALPEKVDLARPGAGHPWGFLDHVPDGGLDAAKIHAAAVDFDAALQQLHAAGFDLTTLARTETPVALAQWAKLAAAPRYPLDGIDALRSGAWQAELIGIAQAATELAHAEPDWLAVCGVAAMELDMPAVHEAALAADASGMFGRKKRRRAVLAQLADVLTVAPETVPLKTLSGMTAQVAETHAAVTDLRARVAALPISLVGEGWNPLIAEDTAALTAHLDWLTRLVADLAPGSERPHIADVRAFYAATPAGALAEPLGWLGATWQRVADTTGVAPDKQHTWAGGSFLEKCWATRDSRRLATPDTVECWVGLIEHIEPLRATGMYTTHQAILAGALDADDAALAFDRGTAIASVGERLEASALDSFDVAAHTKAIQRFTTSTRAIRTELRHAIPARLLEQRSFDAEASSGQVGGLRRQLDRKRGGMSVRALIDNYGELITKILPCTLMSPDSVARFFPARAGIFDVVVFDEASQIRVAGAVGAMGRARSVVVVGDSKQMPPTSFAEARVSIDEDEDYDPTVVLDEESILTECVQAQVPRQWLSWHYRSQDEALIAFSNYQYYDGRLASFPAPAAVGAGHGVSLVRVDGQFQRTGKGKLLRTNTVEAQRIVDDIRVRFAKSPATAPSLGVITFNAQQRDYIENLLRDSGDDRLVAALDEPDGLFVKNLENVQGDERDTILFSVAFSANERGVVPLNFGPLSRPGGERRLNVAVTRARREVVLYASFDPAALRAEETTQVGTKHLKAYLELAARGVQEITDGGRRQRVIDRHRDDIADALRDAGLLVSTDVGLSDFRVDLVLADALEPDKPLVAVLLDGLEWHDRQTVADRAGLPVDVLANLMHWPAVERVWLPEWLNHRAATVARLQAVVGEAREKAAAVPAVETAPVVAPPIVDRVEVAAPLPAPLRSAPVAAPPLAEKRHPMLQTFQPWESRAVGDVTVLDELPMEYAKQKVRTVIDEVIAAEGPIHPDRLAKLVAGAFGLNRVAESRRTAIQRLVPVDYRRSGDPEGFYWPTGVDPATWRVVRCPAEGEGRVLDEVSLVEIGNAMAVVAEQTGGIEAEELKREALGLFGGKRMTAGIEVRLGEALEQVLGKGILARDNAGLIAGAQMGRIV
ncbi:DUF3320 domain-containing protein [Mycolicibacter acidiphilus]|uniref:DUF3320 domain-containing protein n=1 Tax=Mycolicibacter acidiphilus TaxID=2835306 RepID=UPI0027DCEC0D|nr:DUF3320 domain-containing protein [Mycolicibacter acidiphilus]